MQDTEVSPGDPVFWQNRWSAGSTGWDLGKPHPLLTTVFDRLLTEKFLKVGDRIWIPGCGRAHCAAYLAKIGFKTVGTDVITDAISEAKNIYGTIDGLTLETSNALTPLVVGGFEAVFDRAVLCAIAPDQRTQYARSMFEALASGGLFVTFAFTKTARADGKAGPPFGIANTELVALLNPYMTLVSATERTGEEVYGAEEGSPIVSEVTAVFRRREVALDE